MDLAQIDVGFILGNSRASRVVGVDGRVVERVIWHTLSVIGLLSPRLPLWWGSLYLDGLG
ncbi:hypothetical protein B9Q03_06985 [Candidatus Marsarchaeota G2 archaeon OSP_D]|uniref:Uncharacterized protein n=1 Tax=Candidatus Marsarchaeota G2 archaeon OSP_D TaxID=1978157 RepID=A0A2R6AVI1_9ARCH|nr:MAG: hypothetical protein B9Q03_06985 [Candidatus Marsarchaeota G2 archaeon OSP_D]